MHFRNSCSSLFLFLATCFVCSSPLSAQDTLARQLDSLQLKKVEPGSYQNLLFLSGFVANSANKTFYQDYYKQGTGVQLGIPLYSSKYYTLRFNVAYASHRFQRDEYLKTDTLLEGETLSASPLQTVTFLPDIMVHPLPQYILSPYISAGVGVMVGSNLPAVTKTTADGKTQRYDLSLGMKYNAQFGAGVIADVLPYLTVLAGASYNMEFLRNHQPEDIFYKFKKEDNSYRFIYYSIGIQLKIRK